MKKQSVLSVLLPLLALTLALTGCLTQRERNSSISKSEMLIDSLETALNQAKTESDDLMGTVKEIQEGFKAINEAEDIVAVETAAGENSDKQTIAENIALINNKMKLNRELIANLREQLRASNTSNEKLKATLEDMVKNFEAQLAENTKKIEELQKEIEEKNLRIAEQDQQITALNDNVQNLVEQGEQKDADIAQKAENIAKQDKDLHTAYYVFGTKKELKEQRILQHGEVLQSQDFNRAYFTKIDYRATKVIPLYSKGAELLTSHPAGTYELAKGTTGQYTLRITDPDRFWSVSKYLVIQVK